MGIRPTTDADGNILWYDVLAGTVRGKKIRKRFTVGKVKDALRAAQLWEKRTREQLAKARYDVVSVPVHKLPEIIRALELLEPYETTLDAVARDWIKLRYVGQASEPWTFGEAVAECIKSKRDLQVSAHHLRPLEVKMLRIAQIFGERYCDQITTEELEAYARRPLRINRK